MAPSLPAMLVLVVGCGLIGLLTACSTAGVSVRGLLEPGTPPHTGDDPVWYRRVPNLPGVAIFGAGAATAPGVPHLARATQAAREAAVRQLKGRVRQLLDRALHRYPEAILASDGGVAAFVAGCIDGDDGNELDRLTATLADLARTDPATGVLTVWHLVSLDVFDIMQVVEQRQLKLRQARLEAAGTRPSSAQVDAGGAGLPLDELFVAMRVEQELRWGCVPPAPGLLVTHTDPPAWFASPNSNGGDYSHGVGSATAAHPVDILRLGARAERAARLHLREKVRLTLELALPGLLVEATDADSSAARERFLRSVIRAVAHIVSANGEVLDHVTRVDPQSSPGETRARAWTRIGVDSATLCRALHDELVAAAVRELARHDGFQPESPPSLSDIESWWVSTVQTVWHTANSGS